MDNKVKAVYVFPGQGAQFTGMGKDVYENFSSSREIFKQADESLGFPLKKLCFEGPDDELVKTMNVQPAIVSVSLALLAAAREYTNDNLPAPVYVAGHSLGEYTALAVAGVLSPSTAICLARERGRLMQQAGQTSPGAMMAIIGLDEVSLFEICTQTNTYVANYNCPGQTVISGHTNNIEKAGEMAKTKGAARVITLNVSGAFHTPLMETVSKELSDYLDTLAFNNAAVPIIANTTAQEIDSADSIKTELICQLCYSVQWQHTIEYMLNKGVDTFIEIGPGKVLSGLIKRINKTARIINICDTESIRNLNLAAE